MILFPNAKLNIGLNIIKKRTDGYHELESVMFPIGLTDILELNKPTQNQVEKIQFTSSGLVIDGDPENNLVVKAYHLLDKEIGLPKVAVHLHKVIPFGAGLGGGSADGAFMLKGLNSFFSLGISSERLEFYAAKLGSDCPFFINNKPAFATGRGEILSPINFSLHDFCIVLIVPAVHISTALAYAGITPKKAEHNILEYIHLSPKTWKNKIINDFEPGIFNKAPEISELKTKLYELGAYYASMSGSGSSVFGLFAENPKLDGHINQDYFIWKSK